MAIRHLLITFDIFNIEGHSTYCTFQTAFVPKLEFKKLMLREKIQRRNRKALIACRKIHAWFSVKKVR